MARTRPIRPRWPNGWPPPCTAHPAVAGLHGGPYGRSPPTCRDAGSSACASARATSPSRWPSCCADRPIPEVVRALRREVSGLCGGAAVDITVADVGCRGSWPVNEQERAAFRAFVREHHPDRGGDPEVFVAGLARFRPPVAVGRRRDPDDRRYDAPGRGGRRRCRSRSGSGSR